MIETQVTIINKLGLHARAAAKFVGCTSAFSSSIQAGTDGNMVDAKSIMSVMILAASQGSIVTIRCDGEDEAQAMTALEDLINAYFKEEQ